jgi:hypothetical protein
VIRERTTMGGGRVLDPAPPRRSSAERLELLDRGDPVSIVRATVHEPVTRSALAGRALLSPGELDEGLAAVEHAGDWYFAADWLAETKASAHERLERRARSSALDPGLPLAELLPPRPWAAAVLPLLDVERRGTQAYLPGSAASLGDRAGAAEELEAALAEAGGNAVKVDDRELASYLEAQGKLVRVGDGLAVSAEAYETARQALVDELQREDRIRLARFRDLLDISRRSAQLLLERFDADGITRRVGDERVLRRAGGRS